MIYVGGLPFESNSSQGNDILGALMGHPALESASISFRTVPVKNFSRFEVSDLDRSCKGKHVYVFQREYATVDPALVDLIGTDEMTTCVGIVIRNRENGMISVAHIDSPDVVDIGLSQMLSQVVVSKTDADLDVHVIGGFEDAPLKHCSHSTGYECHTELDGYSFPLCAKIVEALEKSGEKFHIQTFFVLGHNTKRDSNGKTYPIFGGFLVETSTGLIIPASFDNTTRCPDELVRRIRLFASSGDSHWRSKLLETYNTQTHEFVIAPCCWNLQLVRTASALLKLPDSEVLCNCSTSPSAENPDFVDNRRRVWDYLIQHPNWKETFQNGQPRIFKRTMRGGWITKVANLALQKDHRNNLTATVSSSPLSSVDSIVIHALGTDSFWGGLLPVLSVFPLKFQYVEIQAIYAQRTDRT
ncbi:hypothetical protein Nepgr_006299 [Nepenthes gracilis]|uniref:Protein N-terminal asparagine amidohydrolase n=1 Tax=Nepenthes gracilis TaxID=150966 RepID=A0AAD3S598_NEPGR|nr:hypothetical protein Nepgr_006299 [Nepenthes gracilis]